MPAVLSLDHALDMVQGAFFDTKRECWNQAIHEASNDPKFHSDIVSEATTKFETTVTEIIDACYKQPWISQIKARVAVYVKKLTVFIERKIKNAPKLTPVSVSSPQKTGFFSDVLIDKVSSDASKAVVTTTGGLVLKLGVDIASSSMFCAPPSWFIYSMHYLDGCLNVFYQFVNHKFEGTDFYKRLEETALPLMEKMAVYRVQYLDYYYHNTVNKITNSRIYKKVASEFAILKTELEKSFSVETLTGESEETVQSTKYTGLSKFLKGYIVELAKKIIKPPIDSALRFAVDILRFPRQAKEKINCVAKNTIAKSQINLRRASSWLKEKLMTVIDKTEK